MKPKLKLLIIEDEQAIRQGLVDVFVFHGFDVDSADNGKAGLELALTGHFDLILLDIMLPVLDGYQVCNKIRAVDKQQPIIMLTAKSSEEDIINGFTLGADDYIAKPFSVRELVLRVNAVLKRSDARLQENAILKVGPVQIDTANLVQINTARPHSFSRREIDILNYLLHNAERPVSREELLEQVWGYNRQI